MMNDLLRISRWSMIWIVGMLSASSSLAGELVASVDWGQRLSMGTLVPGVVQKVEVRAGQRVKSGELLLALEQSAFRAKQVAARSRVRYARILLEEARREFDRAQELYDRTVLSEHELTIAEIGLRKAEAEAGDADAQAVQAGMQLQYSQLKAPFDGIVVRLNASPGLAVVSEQQVPELLVLADDRTLRVTAMADGATLEALGGASQVVVRFGGHELPAMKLTRGLEARPSPQGELLYPVTVLVDRPGDMDVRAGQPARIAW